MELRVLKYFLMVAREENITRAAAQLHVTQPTLSRQLMQLEQELGVTLFKRGKHSILLTDDGMLLKRRAQEIISLTERTRQELTHNDGVLSGEIAIGCGETHNMDCLARQIASFRQQHPLVQFSIYSAIADDIKERIERGLLDLGLLMEPVELSKYDTLAMPVKEVWGVIARRDSPLAEKDSVSPTDLLGVPLIMVKRDLVRSNLANWFGDCFDALEIAATFTLLLNALSMVENGVGVALGFHLVKNMSDALCFIPLAPRLETGAVMVWKKHQAVSPVTSHFIRHMKNAW